MLFTATCMYEWNDGRLLFKWQPPSLISESRSEGKKVAVPQVSAWDSGCRRVLLLIDSTYPTLQPSIHPFSPAHPGPYLG